MAPSLLTHPQRVRLLYKTILRLHRSLPEDIRGMGDTYAKAEFRRHRQADAAFIPAFMSEWTRYAVTLSRQLHPRVGRSNIFDGSGPETRHRKDSIVGDNLKPTTLNMLSDEQLVQLMELYEETKRGEEADNGITQGDNR